MTPLTRPTWRFPPRSGGIDYVNNPSSAHFSDAPIAKLVRELIQNSLDAKHHGFTTPIGVRFSETTVERELIGGDALEYHLEACLDNIAGARPDMVEMYSNAVSVIKRHEIPCLKVQDKGTVGLNDTRWRALVLQEGAVSKGRGAPGGSFGIGKNAILNVSDLRTVFYSTRLVQGRKGLVTKLQGKATLTGHPDPGGSGEDLQHVGFFSNKVDEPIMGKDIPEFFRLADTGTGVFIMGFNPRSSNWVEQVATAVIENFFYAVHNQDLVVDICSQGRATVRVDHQTIDYLFSGLYPINRSAVHYYRAIRDLDDEDVIITEQLQGLGRLRAYLVFDEGLPRRIAHVNRNGMLITDSREQRVNPLAPRGRSLWPDYVCVIVPDSDAGDLWLRRMENPSHDSLSSGHLWGEKERRGADSVLRGARRELRSRIDKKADVDSYGETTNIDELAGILPDKESLSGDRSLRTQVIETGTDGPNVPQISEEVEAWGGGEGDDPWQGNNSKGTNDDDTTGRGGQRPDGDRPIRHRQLSARLRRVRYIPLSSNEAIVAFNPTSDPSPEVRLSLVPAGTDRDPRRTRRVAIAEATRIGDVSEPLSVTDGEIVFTPHSDARVTVRIVADGNLDRQAFKLT